MRRHTEIANAAGCFGMLLARCLGEQLYVSLGMLALLAPLLLLALMAFLPFVDTSQGAVRSMNLRNSSIIGALAAPTAFAVCVLWYWCGRCWRMRVLEPVAWAWVTAILTVIWLVGLLWQVIR